MNGNAEEDALYIEQCITNETIPQVLERLGLEVETFCIAPTLMQQEQLATIKNIPPEELKYFEFLKEIFDPMGIQIFHWHSKDPAVKLDDDYYQHYKLGVNGTCKIRMQGRDEYTSLSYSLFYSLKGLVEELLDCIYVFEIYSVRVKDRTKCQFNIFNPYYGCKSMAEALLKKSLLDVTSAGM